MITYEDGDVALFTHEDVGIQYWIRHDGLWYLQEVFEQVGPEVLAGSDLKDAFINEVFYHLLENGCEWNDGLGLERDGQWLDEPDFELALDTSQ